MAKLQFLLMKFLVPAGFLLVALSSFAAESPHSVGRLRLIGVQTISSHREFQRTVIGGLSGIDYDPASDTWIAETDDKSEFGPTRFYTLKLTYDGKSFKPVEVIGVTLFRQAEIGRASC